MIKFAYLIHKKTDKLISYNQWLEFLDKDKVDFYFQKPVKHSDDGLGNLYEVETNHYSYKPLEMLVNDDFDIIYTHEFTVTELKQIYNFTIMKSICGSDLSNKISNLIDDRYKTEFKYGIEY
jgi:hypothetical protein